MKFTWSVDKTLVAATLNIGGRNTNPLEFLLDGDSSEEGAAATKALNRAQEAMVDAECGPARMAESERAVVIETLDMIFEELQGDRNYIDELLNAATWANVYDQVRRERHGLFNALNLSTIKMQRPSVMEGPAECAQYPSRDDYLRAWQAWYKQIDRKSDFWIADLQKKAAKKNLYGGTAFAGLLVFDLLGLAAASRISVGNTTVPMAESLKSGAVFKVMAAFVETLPFVSDSGKHDAAVDYFDRLQADIVIAQECRGLADHPRIQQFYQPLFSGNDPFTAVLVRRTLPAGENVSEAVREPLLGVLKTRSDLSDDVKKAWKTTCHRIAAVKLPGVPAFGGKSVVAASLHVSKSSGTPDLILELAAVLNKLKADVYVVGLDTNVAGDESAALEKRLSSKPMDLGDEFHDQVTVAKQRTMFQTQTQKAGEIDVSHKDYLITWGSARGATAYSPDLHTSFGVDRATGSRVRLPTTLWPFDHCGVATELLGSKKANAFQKSFTYTAQESTLTTENSTFQRIGTYVKEADDAPDPTLLFFACAVGSDLSGVCLPSTFRS
jgi:hypothetical protein